LTPAQAQSTIEKHVANYVREPHASVTAPPPVEMRTVSAEIGEPRNEALARLSEPVGLGSSESPAPRAPAASPLARNGDGRGRGVIASNWRPVERVAAPNANSVQPAEWVVRRQSTDKPSPP